MQSETIDVGKNFLMKAAPREAGAVPDFLLAATFGTDYLSTRYSITYERDARGLRLLLVRMFAPKLAGRREPLSKEDMCSAAEVCVLLHAHACMNTATIFN